MSRDSADAADSSSERNVSDAQEPSGTRGRPLFTAEMLEQLTPKDAEIERAKRTLLFVVSGCGTFVVLAILAMLYVPYWQMERDVMDTARDYLEAATRGDVEAAFDLSGIRNRDYVRQQVDRFQQAMGPEGRFEIDGLEFARDDEGADDRTYVVGSLHPSSRREPISFRLRVQWSSHLGRFGAYHGEIGNEAAQ